MDRLSAHRQGTGGIPQFDTLIAMGAIVAIAISRVASWDDINQNTDWGC